jgi:hypothetical protein
VPLLFLTNAAADRPVIQVNPIGSEAVCVRRPTVIDELPQIHVKVLTPTVSKGSLVHDLERAVTFVVQLKRGSRSGRGAQSKLDPIVRPSGKWRRPRDPIWPGGSDHAGQTFAFNWDPPRPDLVD